MGLDRRETGLCLVVEVFVSDGRGPWYERNEGSGPLVYQLSDKAMLGNHALTDKNLKASKARSHPKNETHIHFS